MFPPGVTGMNPMHLRVREGFQLMDRNDFAGALGAVLPLLSEVAWAFPSAHFIAGNACMALVQSGSQACSVSRALRHLRLAAVDTADHSRAFPPERAGAAAAAATAGGHGHQDHLEPPLPLPMRAASLRLWLALASSVNQLSSLEAFGVLSDAVAMEGGSHGPTLLLWATWLPQVRTLAAPGETPTRRSGSRRRARLPARHSRPSLNKPQLTRTRVEISQARP
jgi:hypothetical protein